MSFHFNQFLAEVERDLGELDLSPLQIHAVMWRVQSRAVQHLSCGIHAPLNLADLARTIHRLRLRANEVAGSSLFRDPKWEMLLDLFVATEEKRRTSVSALCLAANVPQTTGLRHVETLVAEGFVSREGDPDDRRRSWVELTGKGHDVMVRLLGVYSREMSRAEAGSRQAVEPIVPVPMTPPASAR